MIDAKNAGFDWLPEGCSPLADGEYDAIILGTGLTECIISGLLSVQGKRVLHLDRNNYYGADTASLSLANLYQKFRENGTPPAALGHSRGTKGALCVCSYLYFYRFAPSRSLFTLCVACCVVPM